MDNHILLKDSPAEKADTSFAGTVKTYLGKKHSSVVVVRGELLVPIPENEITPRSDRQTPNYRLKRDPTVTLFCKEDDIAPLGKRDFLLLEGIKSHMARFDVFSNQLDWGLKLKPGDAVYVSLPSQHAIPVQYAAAVIRFVGHLKTEPGIQFGVEITERQFHGYGSTDGFFQGEQLFLCGKNCGLFVGLDKLSPDRQSCSRIKVASSQSESSAKKLPTTNQQHQHEMVTRLKQKTSNSLQRQASGTSDNAPNSTFSIGDRVVVYNKNKARVPGVVRWVGKVTDQGVDLTAVGIETDHPVKKEDFADALSRMSSNFKTQHSHHGKVFLPEAFVVSEEVDRQAKGKRDVDEQKHQDEQEFDQVQKAVTEQIDVDEQIRRLEEIEQERRKLNKPQQKTQQNAPASVNDLVPTSTSCPGTQPPLRGPGLPHSSLPAPPQPNPQPISSQQLDPPHPDHFSADPVGAQGTVAYAPPPQQGKVQLAELDVGSAVQVSDPPRYGVIRWIGELPNIQGTVAGVELDEYMDGCTDGTWRERRYFTCPYGRAFFCPYYNLSPDHRFDTGGNMPGTAPAENPLIEYPMDEQADQTIEHNQIVKYLGDGRGIQGHQNSCYLDATVFGLFALSEVFDSMFLGEARDEAGKEIKSILWKGIVNPLRKNGVVRYESVMHMRNKLEELGKMKGVNQDEKDPEEFLNLLFKLILKVEPFVHIKRPFGVEPEYFVQLFVDYDESLKLPSVGELMKKMFREQDITFTQAPSKLLIQVPRFGKQYKTYEKIIPAAKLNVADLIVSPHQCFICEKSAWKQCSACAHEYRSEERTAGGFVYFCDSCSHVVHSPKSRSNHVVQSVAPPPEVADLSELDLLSVICIETSHYVCFVHWEKRWIFFDSMANRVYDMYNIPKGVDCTHDLNEWVYSGDGHKRLLNTPPRELPEYVRRFTQDIYMCVYVNHDVGMYL